MFVFFSNFSHEAPLEQKRNASSFEMVRKEIIIWMWGRYSKGVNIARCFSNYCRSAVHCGRIRDDPDDDEASVADFGAVEAEAVGAADAAIFHYKPLVPSIAGTDSCGWQSAGEVGLEASSIGDLNVYCF